MSKVNQTPERMEVTTCDLSASRGTSIRTPTLWNIVSVTLRRTLTRSAQAPVDCARDEVIHQAVVCIRAGCCEQAARVLAPLAGQWLRDAAYLNLMGVISESRQQWKSAGRFYGLAISVNPGYAPARQNIRRIYELNTFGRTMQTACLGDIELRPVHFKLAPRASAGGLAMTMRDQAGRN